ncbi:hypothetical protein [Stutzerimonas degradans]|uniref:hypothetical protein n=1 Tax=Stutzerimonas degradans TaxID=2968968 RepID=UPI001F60B412|nr:hypothetical protein [Stutzerimonas degradans]
MPVRYTGRAAFCRAALLEDDCLCWSSVSVEPKALNQDFVVLHLRHTSSGLKTVAKPMRQAHTYFKEVDMVLKKDLLLGRSNKIILSLF